MEYIPQNYKACIPSIKNLIAITTKTVPAILGAYLFKILPTCLTNTIVKSIFY